MCHRGEVANLFHRSSRSTVFFGCLALTVAVSSKAKGRQGRTKEVNLTNITDRHSVNLAAINNDHVEEEQASQFLYLKSVGDCSAQVSGLQIITQGHRVGSSGQQKSINQVLS